MHAARPNARRRLPLLVALAGLLAQGAGATPPDAPAATAAAATVEAPVDRVRVDTTLGSFVIKLETTRAPLTTANFLSYVKSGHYQGTIFHRVISNFVIQGGGYDDKFRLKDAPASVANESGNGLSNKRFTVGLARSESPHSGNAQFYVNLTDNDELDPTPLRWGYTVFGRVVEGLEVVDKIGRTPTGSVGPWPKDAPLEPVVIQRIEPLPASH
jgi:cyclophilin family peptidyl-prolyl cis-trans isomerase